MPSGKLGSATLADTNPLLLYTVPANVVSTVNICIVNTSSTQAKVDIAFSTGGAPVSADYITKGRNLLVSGEYERTGMVASAGEKIFVRSDVPGVTVRIHGFEENV